jgi:hypothetical protein
VERNYAELVTSGLLTGDEWAHLPESRFLTGGVSFHVRI